MKGQELVAYLALLLSFGYLGVAFHGQQVELEQLRARQPDTVYVEVPREVELETWGISCRWVEDSTRLTDGEP